MAEDAKQESPQPMKASQAWEALDILHNMALERDVSLFRRYLRRWHMGTERLRNEAARFLMRIDYERKLPPGTKYVG